MNVPASRLARPRGPNNPYLETRIKTAGSLELTAIIFDVLIGSLERAAKAIADGSIEERVAATNRAVAALVELRCSLDHERGGELAGTLDSLYGYGLGQLAGSDAGQSPDVLKTLHEVFTPLRDAWHEAAKAEERDEAAPAADRAEAAPALSGV